ncbi:MAG: radical SAM protein [Candidatus Ratteibacteria bacterium]|jgi:radical SAM superfamily enzyme YgiQ (UPF0313 family)
MGNIKKNKVGKVMLTQPNYALLGKRTWKMYPYSLGIINASIKNDFETLLLDPNFANLTDGEIISAVRDFKPDVVGVSTCSTEYIKSVEHMTALVRQALPGTIIVEGGVLPTVAITAAMKDKNVDYWIIGEGEVSFLELLKKLGKPSPDLSDIKGLAFFENNESRISRPAGYIDDLDSIPFADYGNLNLLDYGSQHLKYAQGLCAKVYPYAVTITSRGCPYRCIFCSGPRISGKKVRMRSAENVLREVDELYKKGIKEINFLDDHFLFNRKRAIDIMKGLIERKYDLLWKCGNLTVFLLDEEVLDSMKESGSYQITVSIESGNQQVLDKIIKKPVNLKKTPGILSLAKKKGFEIIANFVVGFPGETWEQIRDTFAYADKLEVDLVNFHIATPLPNTELMETCIAKGYLPKNFMEEFGNVGYTHGMISTEEFSPIELEILRAFEWDRINFRTSERKENIARIQGISLDELEKWRKDTRRKLGINVVA